MNHKKHDRSKFRSVVFYYRLQTAELLEQIILENESGDNELLLHSHLLAFLNMVLRDATLPHLHSGQNYRIIKTAKRYMEQHYAECIQLSDIAESKKLLWDSSVSIAEIAESCGFGCQPYFSKIFKKSTGTLPGKYRKELNRQYLNDSLT